MDTWLELLYHHGPRGKKLPTLEIILRVVVRLEHVQSTKANSIISLLHLIPLVVPEF